MTVLAVRDKFIAILGLVLAILLLAVTIICWSLFHPGVKIGLLAIDAIFFIIFGYLILLPKNAITFDGKIFTLRFLFHSENITRQNLKHVSYNEKGTWATRKGDIVTESHVFRNDIRTLTVTFDKNGILKHKHIISVKDCSASALSIESLIKETEN